MKNYIFTTTTNKHFKRINKTEAKKAYINNEYVVICPCNLNPFSVWAPGATINYNDRDETEKETPANILFNKIINCFEYYNCINNETGKYTAFYIEVIE